MSAPTITPAGHTAGPWLVRQSYSAERLIVVAPQPSNRVLAGFGSEDEPLDDTDVANALLIAAAPDLLAALQAFVVRNSSEPTVTVTLRTEDVTRARAAIAKALGTAA